MIFSKKYWIILCIAFVIFIFIKPAICVLLIGSLFMFISFKALLFIWNITKVGIESVGNIIQFQSDGDGYKTPLIEFTTSTGNIIREQPYLYSSSSLNKIRSYRNFIHQPVPILYDPNNPKKFVLKNKDGFNYFSIVLFMLVGLLCLVFGIALLCECVKFG